MKASEFIGKRFGKLIVLQEAEDELQGSYLEAFRRHERLAAADPIWAKDDPSYFQALCRDGRFFVNTYEG